MKTLFLSLLLLFSASAEEVKFDTLTTKEGKTYNKVVVTDSNPAEIAIRHENGTCRIPLQFLPPDLAKLYPWKPAEAREFKEREAVLQKQLEAAMTAPITREEVQKSIEREIDRAQITPEEKAKRRQLLIKKLEGSKLQSSRLEPSKKLR